MRAILMVAVTMLAGCSLYSGDDDLDPGIDAAAGVCEAPPPCRGEWNDACPADFCTFVVTGRDGQTTTCAVARGDDGCP